MGRKWDPLPDPPPLEPPLLVHPPQLPKRSPRPPLRRKSLLISVMVSTCSEMKRNTERIGEPENARYPEHPCSSSIIVSKFVKNLNPSKNNLYYQINQSISTLPFTLPMFKNYQKTSSSIYSYFVGFLLANALRASLTALAFYVSWILADASFVLSW